MRILFYETSGATAKAEAKAAKARAVDVLACNEAEEVDEIAFTDDVSAFQRKRINVLFGRIDPLDHDGDGRKGGSKKGGPQKKAAAVEPEAPDPLDTPQDAAGGLTIRELHADCEANGVEIDPSMTIEGHYELLQVAKAEKADKAQA